MNSDKVIVDFLNLGRGVFDSQNQRWQRLSDGEYQYPNHLFPG